MGRIVSMVATTTGQRQQGVVLLCDLDLATEELANLELADAVDDLPRGGLLVMDVNGHFIDVRGLAVIERTGRRANRRGRRFAVRGASQIVRRMYALFALGEVFDLHPEGAIRHRRIGAVDSA